MLQETSIGIGAESYVHGVLEKALGTEKAERLVAPAATRATISPGSRRSSCRTRGCSPR